MRMVAALALLVWLGGCGSMTLETEPPARFDLNGSWRLVPGRSDEPPNLRVLRARGGSLSLITQDFPMLRATGLAIEQGPDSMGIAFTPGGYQDVTWGERRRGLWDVRAGWHEGDLVLLYRAPDAEARETFTLAPGGTELRVRIDLRASGDGLVATRIFRQVAD